MRAARSTLALLLVAISPGAWARPGTHRRSLAHGVDGGGQRAADGNDHDDHGDRAAVDPLARAQVRETFLAARAAATEQRARAQALAATRLARRRGVDFLGDPTRRVATARALNATLLVLRRSATETAGWRRELEHAQAERAALQLSAGKRSAEAPRAGDPATLWSLYTPATLSVLASLGPGAGVVFAPWMAAGIAWPARGTLVSGPGIRRDPATGTDSISESVEILSRMNEPVHAVAAGKVRKTVALPQGGWAVVMEHADARISILSGLRQVDVAPGDEVTAGQTLGLVGRDLDGAPVLAFELWQDRAPIDPRPLLPPVR